MYVKNVRFNLSNAISDVRLDNNNNAKEKVKNVQGRA